MNSTKKNAILSVDSNQKPTFSDFGIVRVLKKPYDKRKIKQTQIRKYFFM